MEFRKVAGPMRVETSGAGGQQTYELEARPGGRKVKSVQYMIKVLQRSSANLQLGLRLDHGPDGKITANHSTPIALAVLPAAPPLLVVGDANSAIIVGEWLHPVVIVDDNASGVTEWATIEVYEMAKPF